MDKRGCALDLGHFDPRAGLDHLVVEERAGAPLLAAELDAPAIGVHALEDERARADQRRRAGAQPSRGAEMADGEGPQ